LKTSGRTWLAVTVATACVWFPWLACSAASAKMLSVTWMPGFSAPGTPARYDKVGVLKIGPSQARNVLVLEPGTSAGSGYFVPLAEWLVSKVKGWQVWSVERRENLLEDQSVFNLAKQHRASNQRVFNYYLGWLTNANIKHHIQTVPDSEVPFARKWGLNVAVQDLHSVIGAAGKLGGKVVLGGHSLGGSVVTAYATWNFAGRPGADELAGLVYDDGASIGPPVTAQDARQSLHTLQTSTPWLAFSGVPAPFLGLYSTSGSLGALLASNAPSIGQTFKLLPAALKPPVRVTNLAIFGYDVDVKTSKLVFAAQAHVGHLDTSFSPARWSRGSAITPVRRYATMLSGLNVNNADGSEWYFPQRLTDDTGAIGNGIANPAQHVLDVHATMGRHLPRRLLMYAFGAYGGKVIVQATQALARQSHIPMRNLTLVNRHRSYAHNDPAAAYPHNVFFTHLVAFLHGVSGQR
jgi:pimeloyl-ACP methyl ester carboxylesterase